MEKKGSLENVPFLITLILQCIKMGGKILSAACTIIESKCRDRTICSGWRDKVQKICYSHAGRYFFCAAPPQMAFM
jgi:hypothetical protein